MRQLVEGVEVACDAGACWTLFQRLSLWPRWFPALTRLERPDGRPPDAPLAPGDELVLHLALLGRATAVRVKIAEICDWRVRWVGRSLGVTGDHAFYVEALAGGRARLVSDERFTGLPVRLVPARFWRVLADEARAGLERFRALAEAPAA